MEGLFEMPTASETLVEAVAALVRGPEPAFSFPTKNVALRKLTEAVCAEYPEAVSKRLGRRPNTWATEHALLNAMLAFEVPWQSDGEPAQAIADILDEALRRRDHQVLHLCPLNFADNFPEIEFGACKIKRFEPAELIRLLRFKNLSFVKNAEFEVDVRDLAEFQFLVVEERESLTIPIGERAAPYSYVSYSQDFARIEPYASDFPTYAQLAIFLMLLLPWEDMVEDSDFDWRGFTVRWVHSISDDPFKAPSKPPSRDTLTWETVRYADPDTGESEESDEPGKFELKDSAYQEFSDLDVLLWNQIEATLRTNIQSLPAANPLVAHFLVRAFRSEGIDEFLAHMTAIEAALGLSSDYGIGGKPPKLPGNPRATARVARRVRALTGNASSDTDYANLFELRSQFVHGRVVQHISGEDRIKARRLARIVARDLFNAAAAQPNVSREAFLSRLCP